MRRLILPSALLLLFLIHFAAGYRFARYKPDFYYHNDGAEYAELAESFAATGAMTIAKPRYYEAPRTEIIPEAYRSPLLSFLGGILIRAGLTPAFAYALLQAALATAAAGMIFLVAECVDPSRITAWFAFLLYNLHPLIFEYSVQFCSETLFTLCILCFIRAFQMKESGGKYILLAIAGAAMTLTRPTGLVFLPGGVLVLLLLAAFETYRKTKSAGPVFRFRTCRNALIYGICFFLLMLPFGIRNQVLFGKFTLSTFFGGYNFYVGNNRENLKAYFSASGPEFLRHQNKGWNDAIALVQALPEPYHGRPALQHRYMMRKGMEEIRAMGVWNYLGLSLAKAWQFFCPWPMPGVHRPLLFWGLTLWELGLFGFGIAGLWLKRKEWMRIVPFAVVVAGGLAAHVLVHVYMRHRIPFLDPALIVFGAVSLRALFEKICPRLCFLTKRDYTISETKGN